MTYELDKRSAAEVSSVRRSEDRRTRKGSAVYVSLSSYSLVKEHGDGSPMSGLETLSALENGSNRRSGLASFSLEGTESETRRRLRQHRPR